MSRDIVLHAAYPPLFNLTANENHSLINGDMFFPSIFSNADSKRKKKNKLRLIELEVFVAVFFDQALYPSKD